jgi:hypothetical protein
MKKLLFILILGVVACKNQTSADKQTTVQKDTVDIKQKAKEDSIKKEEVKIAYGQFNFGDPISKFSKNDEKQIIGNGFNYFLQVFSDNGESSPRVRFVAEDDPHGGSFYFDNIKNLGKGKIYMINLTSPKLGSGYTDYMYVDNLVEVIKLKYGAPIFSADTSFNLYKVTCSLAYVEKDHSKKRLYEETMYGWIQKFDVPDGVTIYKWVIATKIIEIKIKMLYDKISYENQMDGCFYVKCVSYDKPMYDLIQNKIDKENFKNQQEEEKKTEQSQTKSSKNF